MSKEPVTKPHNEYLYPFYPLSVVPKQRRLGPTLLIHWDSVDSRFASAGPPPDALFARSEYDVDKGSWSHP